MGRAAAEGVPGRQPGGGRRRALGGGSERKRGKERGWDDGVGERGEDARDSIRRREELGMLCRQN